MAQLEKVSSLVTALPFTVMLMEKVMMIVARVGEQKCSSMSSTLGTLLLMFLIIRLNDRQKNHVKGFAYRNATILRLGPQLS